MDRAFQWDAAKNAQNVRKHGIDFEDAIGVFDLDPLVSRSDRFGEARHIAVGPLASGRIITVVFTIRGEVTRIISARRARKNEEIPYRDALAGR
ncbi:MAG: BrnT family toxin [Rhodospirillaceae bacterium]|nr:BrnT family toxin [Rhodospirillaceae bacterium]